MRCSAKTGITTSPAKSTTCVTPPPGPDRWLPKSRAAGLQKKRPNPRAAFIAASFCGGAQTEARTRGGGLTRASPSGRQGGPKPRGCSQRAPKEPTAAMAGKSARTAKRWATHSPVPSRRSPGGEPQAYTLGGAYVPAKPHVHQRENPLRRHICHQRHVQRTQTPLHRPQPRRVLRNHHGEGVREKPNQPYVALRHFVTNVSAERPVPARPMPVTRQPS